MKTSIKTLKNGLKLILVEDKTKNATNAELIVKYGSAVRNINVDGETYEIKPGLAHLLEHTMIEDSMYGNVSKFFRDNYVYFNGFTSESLTYFPIETVKDFKKHLKVLIEYVNKVSFTEEKLEEIKKPVIDEIIRSKDRSYYKYNQVFTKVIHNKDHFESTLGKEEDVLKITTKDLMFVHDAFYQPDNEILSISGNFDTDDIIKYIEEIYDNLNIKKKSVTILDPCNDAFVDEKEIIYEDNDFDSLASIVYKFDLTGFSNIDLLNEASDDEDELSLLIFDEYKELKRDVDKLEIQTYLNGEYDGLNAIIEIHAGAGGTESCDWANMLFRMYSRYADKSDYSFILLDKQDGDEAGIKSVMFQINGLNAYGRLKHENGIHRLVRISPFDSNKRRHTSFASVLVMPEINKNIDVKIDDKDLRIDIYRSSGPGGQGVNTTDSAVRITHIPTGIVVTCQNERSQIRNKEKALEILKNKLYLVLLDKQSDDLDAIRGEQLTNGFGSAKRSYVMCPYTLVKDNDSGYENSNVNDILDGNIDDMIEYNIKFSK